MADLEKLMKLREEATPGPWKVATWYGGHHTIRPKREPEKLLAQIEHRQDAAYICAACNAVPDMVKNIRELEGTVVRLGLMLADAYKYIDPARLPEISTSVMAHHTLEDMIEKFRRENFPDTEEAGGEDHA